VTQYLVDGGDKNAVPLVAVTPGTLDPWLALRPEAEAAWIEAAGFDAEPGSLLAVPGGDGGIAMTVVASMPSGVVELGRCRRPPAQGHLPPGRRRPGTVTPRSRRLAGRSAPTSSAAQAEGRARLRHLEWPAGCDRAASPGCAPPGWCATSSTCRLSTSGRPNWRGGRPVASAAAPISARSSRRPSHRRLSAIPRGRPGQSAPAPADRHHLG